ncbi:hypothetical protein EC991_006627 [Linnemannia zychae]|nr:hypothetical protein EC991_006627 [Linnemannia zychae]
MGNYSSWPHHLPPPPPTSSSPPADRPTHRRILSESDIVQPKPMFRKFCLDVLSATLLSPSVILLSLKYIQQLMINLKESNKVVNTGEGAEYRFFTGALILANKFLDDNTFTNKTWADITGMKIKDVNHLEMQFLSGIEFRLFTSSWQYSEWLAKLTQFTGTYMPSQHEVAYQQQTAAAQSPISPMDPNATIAAAEVSSGSGPVRDHGHNAVSGSDSSDHPSAAIPTSALSMASISHYIDSVKHIQQTSGSSTIRFQRVPASTSYYHPSQPASNPVTVPSHQQQCRNQNHQQQQQPQSHCSSLQLSGSFTSSPSSLPFAYQQQRSIEPVHRKRSAIIAFEDVMDRSPRYESGFLPQSMSQKLPGNTISRHKRFSSSSSVATLMGSLSTGSDSFYNGNSPMIQQQQQRYQQSQQQQQHRPLSNLPQRASSGALSHSFRTGGHHHRSASGGNFYVDMSSAGSSPYRHEPSTSYSILSVPSNPRTSGVHPLEEDHQCQGYHAHSKGSNMPSQHLTQPSHQQPQQQRQNYRGLNYDSYSTTSPSYSPNDYSSPCRSMGCNTDINRNSQGGVNPTNYEIDPRLWGPLDSLSLYAITTQAAKRVVAQGKALTSSANGLHMYYPTTLA